MTYSEAKRLINIERSTLRNRQFCHFITMDETERLRFLERSKTEAIVELCLKDSLKEHQAWSNERDVILLKLISPVLHELENERAILPGSSYHDKLKSIYLKLD